MVHLYIAQINHLPDPKEAVGLLSDLLPGRKEKIMRCRVLSARKQSFGAGLLLKKVLSEYEIDTADVHTDANGKPFANGICFNLSHTEGLVICAVSKEEIGCDVEKIKPAPGKAAERYFTKNEAESLRQCGPDHYDEAFTRLWTMKESYMKMTGEGMRLALNQFEISMEKEGIFVYRDGVRQPCRIKEYDYEGYQISVCAGEAVFGEKIEVDLLQK